MPNILVGITDEDREKIKTIARLQRLNMSQFVRRSIVKAFMDVSKTDTKAGKRADKYLKQGFLKSERE